MRPQQQNRRMRGRSNNNNNSSNRKGPNPLTRNYESNGPDVKIRGSAQQIADKYTTLARDAQSSGDRVMAENYLQHAEHYNRIIAAAQAQMPIQHVRDNRDDMDEDVDYESEVAAGNAPETVQAPANNGSGPQPVIEGTPAEVALNQETMNRNDGERREQQASPEPQPIGSHAPHGEAGEEGQQRRSRRPRRGRGRQDQELPSGNSGIAGNETVTPEAAPETGQEPSADDDTSLATADN
jgi:Domain of unknown function (DUF4167)